MFRCLHSRCRGWHNLKDSFSIYFSGNTRPCWLTGVLPGEEGGCRRGGNSASKNDEGGRETHGASGDRLVFVKDWCKDRKSLVAKARKAKKGVFGEVEGRRNERSKEESNSGRRSCYGSLGNEPGVFIHVR